VPTAPEIGGQDGRSSYPQFVQHAVVPAVRIQGPRSPNMKRRYGHVMCRSNPNMAISSVPPWRIIK